METLIVICLVIVIVLLLQDKVVIKKKVEKEEPKHLRQEKYSDIMGQPKPFRILSVPKKDTKSQLIKPQDEPVSFDPQTEENGFAIEIPQEELDEVFDEGPDLDEEEEEWRRNGEPNGEDGFATGVTFEELSAVGMLLQQEALEPSLQKQAADIVQKMQGTELFNLLENSIENASQKIARLLDKRMGVKMDSSSSSMRNNGLEDFDIREFI